MLAVDDDDAVCNITHCIYDIYIRVCIARANLEEKRFTTRIKDMLHVTSLVIRYTFLVLPYIMQLYSVYIPRLVFVLYSNVECIKTGILSCRCSRPFAY